jgi:hypothetical protein
MKRLTHLTALVTATLLTITAQIASTQAKPTHFAAESVATSTSADPRVRTALESLGLNYEVDENGNYVVTLRSPTGNRRQVAVIASETTRLGPLEIREVLSPAYVTDGTLPSDVANTLLADSGSAQLGAWQTYNDGKQSMAIFTARIDANSNAGALEAALYAVLDTADHMENQLTGKDYF